MRLNSRRNSLWIAAPVAAMLTLAACGGGAEEQATAEPCDRDCLNTLMDDYFAALVAHDPTAVPLAENVKFVENSIPMKPGEGLWLTATDVPTTFKIPVPDPVSHEVGAIAMMEEDRSLDPNAPAPKGKAKGKAGEDLTDSEPIEVAVRLKLDPDTNQIVEAEHMIARSLREPSLENLREVRAAILATVPEDERISREEMLRIGASYYDALVNNDGSAAPFAEDCVRRENGMQTTGNPPSDDPNANKLGMLGCAAQLDAGTFQYITRIEPRRVEIADPVTGLVMGFSQFRHPMEQTEYEIKGVEGMTKQTMNFDPFDLPAAHIFVVRGGKMHEIEAMGYMLPYNSPTGWEEEEQ